MVSLSLPGLRCTALAGSDRSHPLLLSGCSVGFSQWRLHVSFRSRSTDCRCWPPWVHLLQPALTTVSAACLLPGCPLLCCSWGICVTDAEWDDRRYQMTLLDMDGYLWVMGGSRAGRNQDRQPTQTQPPLPYPLRPRSLTSVVRLCCQCGARCGASMTCLP